MLEYEFSCVPLSLANANGQLHMANKSQLFPILEGDDSVCTALPPCEHPTCTIIDGMALLRAIGKPSDSRTFGDLAKAYIHAIKSYFNQYCDRVDVVFDRYLKYSIKCTARQQRNKKNKGILCRIHGINTKLPSNWNSFISVNENKNEISKFLTKEILECDVGKGKEIIVSGGFQEDAQSSLDRNVTHLNSTHEEADVRMLLHAADANRTGYYRLIIRSPPILMC